MKEAGNLRQVGDDGEDAQAPAAARTSLDVDREGPPEQRQRVEVDSHGAGKSAPTARDSSAITRATCSTNAGSPIAPSPMLCGKTLAPATGPTPWTLFSP
jgi:hypothetical protein